MIIKLKLIDNTELLFPESYIQKLCDNSWFLKNLIEDCIEGNEIEKFEIPETKELIMSIIQTLSSKKICLNNGISIEYFEYVADQWTLPEWVFVEINKYKLEKSNDYCYTNSLNKNTFMNKITIECKKCNGGYKLHENTNTSCLGHPGYIIDNRYSCCNKEMGSNTCLVSYHIPTMSHLNEVMRISNMIPDN